MVDLQSFTRWNAGLGKTISAIGSDSFFTALFAALGEQVAHVYPQIWLYHRDLPPRMLYHEIPEHAVELQVDRYLEGLPGRPVLPDFHEQPRSSIYKLSRLTGETFEDSGYYRDYYGDTGTCDEVIFLTRLDDGSVVNFCVMRLQEEKPFDEDEQSALQCFRDRSLPDPVPLPSGRVRSDQPAATGSRCPD